MTLEVLDAAGQRIDAFGPSDPFSGDDLLKTLTWKGNPSVEKLAGKPVGLRFNLRNAELYSLCRPAEGVRTIPL